MVEVLPVETPTLGDRSYLVHDGDVALVIDAQRDIDRVTSLADAQGVRITHVAETHMHNDYITGGLALVRETGASYLVNAADPVSFDRTAISDGDMIRVSDGLAVRVMATPGHTFTHLSYALEADGVLVGVFTGGSLLYGSTGRTDLLGPASTDTLARAQHASARRLARELPESAAVYPTHGFGSFCSATQSEASASTIGREKRLNPVLTLDERAYVESLLAGLDAWPAYYAHMGPSNLAGPAAADLAAPRVADPAELRRRIEAGEWVIDLRDRIAFAAGYLPGSLCFSLDGSLATYLGWMIPWGAPVTLLGETPEQVAQAQRELVRIGIDRPAAVATGQPQDWSAGAPLASLRLAKFGDLATVTAGRPAPAERDGGHSAGAGGVVVLDVRLPLEWQQSHIVGAVHIPLHGLPSRVAEIPAGEVWVHCRAGYRSTVAASVLAAKGRDVVCIDDDFDNARTAGLALTGG